MRRRFSRSISVPIVLASVTVVLSVAMLVGWIVILLQNRILTRDETPHTWLLVFGVISFGTIATVLVLFSVMLVREILEVRRQERFIDSVTHELKSPLASMKLCLETLARPELNPQQQNELRTMMVDDVERLSVFIDDVLEASRLSSDRRSHALDQIALHELVQHCAHSVSRRYKTGAQAIEIDIPPSLVVASDRTALETILKNLLDNAVKYSTEPFARVSAHALPSGTVCIRVVDQGIGVPPTELKRIFDRFYRVADETVRQRPGTGLGLFVVKSLVRSLGGRIKAESAGNHQGLTITLDIPHASSSK